MSDLKYMSVDEFWKLGLVQEINRRFLHPMGLALSVTVDDVGNATEFNKIWDSRDDAEGMRFGEDMISKEKYEAVEKHYISKKEVREANLGYFIQPVKEK